MRERLGCSKLQLCMVVRSVLVHDLLCRRARGRHTMRNDISCACSCWSGCIASSDVLFCQIVACVILCCITSRCIVLEVTIWVAAGEQVMMGQELEQNRLDEDIMRR